MTRALALYSFVILTYLCFGQSFEAEKGGFYFFAPSKSGFVGMSTVALNIGVGEYVSSGNTVTTFYKDGSKMGTSSVDCRDGLTSGFANPENDYAYLLSYYVNTKNSVYKLVIYQADKEADLNRVTVNLKSQFGTILGRGKYVLDLKYAVATDNSFLFVFSKYQDKIESFYLVQVKNSDNSIRMKDLNIAISDAELEAGKRFIPDFVYDGKRSVFALQLNKNKAKYVVDIASYSLADLKSIKLQKVQLDFINEKLNLCPIDATKNSRSHESGFGSVIDRGDLKIKHYLDYNFFNDNIVITGLYNETKSAAGSEQRAKGMFYATVVEDSMPEKVLKKVDLTIDFKYTMPSDITPAYYSAFGDGSFYLSFIKPGENSIWVTKNAVTPQKVNIKKAGVEQAVIEVLDEKNHIADKYLKEDDSKLIESLKSFYCLYDSHTNSVGYYTKFSIQEFPK